MGSSLLEAYWDTEVLGFAGLSDGVLKIPWVVSYKARTASWGYLGL